MAEESTEREGRRPRYRKRGFWERNLAMPIPSGQLVFDVVFGVLLPVLCFAADPGIFVFEWPGLLGLWMVGIFATGAAAISVLALIVWLVSRVPSGFLAGCMAGGALVSLAIGCAILPLTLVGTVMLIGLLGLTPFLTSFVMLRNAVRAWIHSAVARRPVRIAAAALGLLFVIAGPGVAQWRANEAVASATETIVVGEGPVDGAVATLRLLGRFYDEEERLQRAWAARDSLGGPDRADRIAEAYLRITGTEISPPDDD